MHELILLLRDAGINTKTLVRVIGTPEPTVILRQEFLRFYRGTDVDKKVSQLIDDGFLQVVFFEGDAYFKKGPKT